MTDNFAADKKKLMSWPTLAAMMSAAIGLAVLIGWVLDVHALKSIVPGWVTMKANTALCFVLLGLSLGLQRLPMTGKKLLLLSRWACYLGLAIACATIVEYAFRIDTGIDQLLFTEASGAVATAYPGRMAVNTAICYVLLFSALLSLRSKKLWVARLLSLVAGSAASIALIGYAAGLTAFYAYLSITAMAAHTATGLLIAAAGIYAAAQDPSQSAAKERIEKITRAGFVLALMLVLTMAAVSLRYMGASQETQRKVLQTRDFQLALEELLSKIKDGETSSRGFVITGNHAFLKLYEESESKVPEQLKLVGELAAADGEHRQSVDALSALTRRKYAFMEYSIALRRGGGKSAADMVSTGRGKAAMDSIRQIAAAMNQRENDRLHERQNMLARNYRGAAAVMLTGIFLQLSLLAGLYFMLSGDVTGRRQAEIKLLATNEELEASNQQLLAVEDELRVSNEELEASNQQLMAAEEELRASNEQLQQHREHLEELVDRRSGELRISETRLRGTMDNMMEGCQIIGKDWRYVYINDAAERHNRCPKKELMGQRYMDMWPGIEATLGFAAIKKCLEEGVSHSMENEFVFPDGSQGWFELSIQPVPEGVFILSSDITERKRAEEKLKESERRFEALFHSNLEAVYLHDFQGKMLDANQATLELIGYSKEELPFLDFTKLVANPQHTQNVTTALGELKEEGRLSRPLDLEIIRKDGTRVWVESTGTVVYRDGQPQAVLGIGKDVTARKRAVDDLKAATERFNQLTAKLNDVVWSASPNGDHVIDINDSFERIYGHSAQAYRDNPRLWIEMVHPDDRGIAEQSSRDLFIKGQAHAEYRIVRLDGKIRWLNDRKSLITDEKGNPVLMGGVATDITERKLLEDQLRQSQKMEAVGQLAGGVAHDFNNMLAGIMGNAELLKHNLTSLPEHTVYLDKILSAAEHAASLTKQLLSFSRKGQVQTKAVNLHQIIDDAIGILSVTIDKRIKIEKKFGAQNADMLGDPANLENALLNLGINARDAMPQGGVVTFATETAEIEDDFALSHGYRLEPGKYIQISVSDNGCGMSDEIKKRIFEPFFTTKEQGKGTGLGMAAVYGIVKNHKGGINIYSEPGQGAIIKLYLPVSGESPAEKTPDKPSLQVTGHGRILLVEDEEMIRAMAGTMLVKLGYEVAVCCNGQEAVDYYRRHENEIDLVIMDLIMPVKNGSEALSEIRQINPNVRAVVSSGFGEGRNNHMINEMDIKAFVQKPYRMAELAEKIAKALA
jgi:PAS domain S-box-containing protein